MTRRMPGGMAMQVYGIKDPSSWPSPLNGLFAEPGSAGNMLAAPIHFLLFKPFALYAIFVLRALPTAKGLDKRHGRGAA